MLLQYTNIKDNSSVYSHERKTSTPNNDIHSAMKQTMPRQPLLQNNADHPQPCPPHALLLPRHTSAAACL
ncbi:MAG: hypothetical protein MJA30_18655, partial [Cytophagales bacterium]|nr:hypothetical protein [Cytophagales bacterium]